MAILLRRNPVAGNETLLTSVGEITFINGEAEIDDALAASLPPISDIRVRMPRSADAPPAAPVAPNAAEEAAKAAEQAEKEAEEAAAKAVEQAEKEAAEAAAKAVEQAEKEAAEAAEAAAKAVKAAPAPVVSNKKLPPAIKS